MTEPSLDAKASDLGNVENDVLHHQNVDETFPLLVKD
jgi:hypothetical protein